MNDQESYSQEGDTPSFADLPLATEVHEAIELIGYESPSPIQAQAIPYLADVARLEWARMESYFAHDANLLNPKTLDAIPPEQLKTVIFKVHPSYRLIQSSFPVFTTWEVNQPEYGEIPELDFSESERGSVLRIGHQIVQRKLSEPEFHWLKLITAGEMLGNATASVMSTTPSFDLQETLKIVLVEGVICGICDERE